MGVIVTVIGPRASHPDRLIPFLKITNQVPVEPFAAIIKIQSQQTEWQALFHSAGLLQNSRRTAVPHGSPAGPTAGDVSESKAPDKVSSQTAAAVSYTVGFQ